MSQVEQGISYRYKGKEIRIPKSNIFAPNDSIPENATLIKPDHVLKIFLKDNVLTGTLYGNEINRIIDTPSR